MVLTTNQEGAIIGSGDKLVHEIFQFDHIGVTKLKRQLRVEVWSNSWVFQAVCDPLGLYAYGHSDRDAYNKLMEQLNKIFASYESGDLATTNAELAGKVKKLAAAEAASRGKATPSR